MMQTLKVWQGIQRDYEALQINNNDGTPAVNLFTADSVLSATVWEGANQFQIFAPTVVWFAGAPTGTGYLDGQFSISFLAADTLTLDPAGEYHVLISATTDDVTAAVWEGMLSVRATPGSAVPSPPDLITYDYCLGFLRQLDLTDQQIDVIPLLIPAASNLWRLICGELNFDQRTYTEWHPVGLDGYVRLWQQPVQIVTRVQGAPNLAMTITNNSSSVQTAQAYFTYTGYDGGAGLNAKLATGVMLAWTSNGAYFDNSLTPITFLDNPTISQLVTAINNFGSGWSATVDTDFGNWPSTELTGGYIGQGCTSGSLPSQGAQFNVLTDLSDARLNPRTPMLWVGRQFGGNVDAQRWGPGGGDLFGGYDQSNTCGLVKVTYVAGYPTIPAEIQNQVAQIVKWKLELGIQELLLGMERAADYEYKMEPSMAHAVPQPVREAAGWWKQSFA